MHADWDYVKATTLWPYEVLIQRIQAVLAYPFVQQHYARNLPEAVTFLQRLILPTDWSRSEYWPEVTATLRQLHDAGEQDYADLVARVATRTKCLDFLAQHDLAFPRLIDLLNCLFRWLLPFATATRELLEHDNPQEMGYYRALKQPRLTASLALLEQGRTCVGRLALAETTGLSEPFLTQIVHRADMARLPYVRRKTILPVCSTGYDTLTKIAQANLPEMEAALTEYVQRTQGKSWRDFKSVIVLRGLIRGAGPYLLSWKHDV